MTPADQNCQACLDELCKCQQCLSDIREELDTYSSELVEDSETLTRVSAVYNSLVGIKSVVRTFPNHRRAA